MPRTKTPPVILGGGVIISRSTEGNASSAKSSTTMGGLQISYTAGDQVVILSKFDGTWYRASVEEIGSKGEVIVTHGKEHGNETVTQKELATRLRQRTIHLENMPPGWTGKYLLRLPEHGHKDQPAGDLHIFPPPPACFLRSFKAAREMMEGNPEHQALIEQAYARLQQLKVQYEALIREDPTPQENHGQAVPSSRRDSSSSTPKPSNASSQPKAVTPKASGSPDAGRKGTDAKAAQASGGGGGSASKQKSDGGGPGGVPDAAFRFADGDEILAELRGCWYKAVRVVRATAHEVEIDFGDEVEVVPARDWRSRLFNRTVHIKGLPVGWKGIYVLRDMPAPNSAPQSRTGDFIFFVEGYKGPGTMHRIRSCKEARQLISEMHPGNEQVLAALSTGVEKAREEGNMMSKHMRSQDEPDYGQQVGEGDAAMNGFEKPTPALANGAGEGVEFVSVCWECKRGQNQASKPSTMRCRGTWGHTDVDWRLDPRTSDATPTTPAGAQAGCGGKLGDNEERVKSTKEEGEYGRPRPGGGSKEERQKAREDRHSHRDIMGSEKSTIGGFAVKRAQPHPQEEQNESTQARGANQRQSMGAGKDTGKRSKAGGGRGGSGVDRLGDACECAVKEGSMTQEDAETLLASVRSLGGGEVEVVVLGALRRMVDEMMGKDGLGEVERAREVVRAAKARRDEEQKRRTSGLQSYERLCRQLQVVMEIAGELSGGAGGCEASRDAARIIKRDGSRCFPSAEFVKDLEEEVRRAEAAVKEAESKFGPAKERGLVKVRDVLAQLEEEALSMDVGGSGGEKRARTL